MDDQVIVKVDSPVSQESGDLHLLLDELSPHDFLTYEKSILHDYHKIYDGLFDSPLFDEWLQGRQWRLRCHGSPRSGKTTFAAAIAEDIRRRKGFLAVSIFLDVPGNDGHLLLEHTDRKGALSRCILRQIVERKVLLNEESTFISSIRSGSVDLSALSLESIEKIIASETVGKTGIYVVFDGCADDELLTEFHNDLNTIADVRFGALSIEPSARFPDALEDSCNSCDALGIDVFWRCKDCPEPDEIWADFCKECLANGGKCAVDDSHVLTEPYKFRVASLGTDDDALRAFIIDRLEEEAALNTSLGLQLRNSMNDVAERIFDKSQNSFAMARLNIEHLIEHQSLTDVIGTFSRLPRFVNEYYDGVLQSIADGPDAKTALTTLSVAAAALKNSRPLTCDELDGALHRQFGEDYKGVDITKDNIAVLTSGLLGVSVDELEGQQSICTFHNDVPTYLSEECDAWFADINTDMAMLCISRVRDFLQEDNNKSSRDILDDYLHDAFLKYAWEYWGQHYANHSSVEAHRAAEGLLADVDNCSVEMNRALYLIRITSAHHDERYFDRPYGTPLHICAHFGLVDLARRYLAAKCSSQTSRQDFINSADAITGATALMIAVEHDRLEFVRFLLQEEASLEVHDYFDHSPLSRAIERTVQLRSSEEDTGAIEHIISLLLAKLSDAAVNAHVMENQTLLMLAIQHKQEAIIQSLLGHENLDLSVTDSRGRNIIHVAADNAHCELLHTIAAKHRQALEDLVTRHDDSGRSPIVAVLQQSSDDAAAAESALRLLRTCGADFTATNDRAQTALHQAVSSWAPDTIIGALLDCDVPIDAQDQRGRTALHLASAADNTTLVHILLDRGADLTREDVDGLTALGSAQRRRSSAQIQQLLASPTEPTEDADNIEFSTLPLWQQVRRDSAAFTELFASTGSLPDTQIQLEADPFGQTALHWAVESVDRDAIRVLLDDERIDANAKDATGTTALQMAVNKLLLEESNVEEHLQAIDELFLPNPRVSADITNAAGLTILQQAMDNIGEGEESLELALILVSHNVPLTLPRHKLQLLYKLAVRKGRHELLDTLIAAGAHPLRCRLPFCSTHEDDEEEEHSIVKAHRLGDEVLLNEI